MAATRHTYDQERAGKALLEIQIHPADIRRGVYYFFLSRRRLVVSATLVGLFLLFVVTGLVLAPSTLRGILSRQEYQSLVSERARQGERLKTLTGQLARLDGNADELHLKMSRIYLAYGLDSGSSAGQGGYPFEPAPSPESIYGGVVHRGREIEAHLREQLGVLGTFIQEVQSFETDHGDQVRTTPSVAPLRGGDFVLTSPFGSRRSPFTKQLDNHSGLDLAAPLNTPIHAPADGVVVFAGRYPLRYSVSWWRYGNLVALRHGSRFITIFGHCEEIKVKSGQKVNQGEVIATVGNTGWSTSPHLHYEVRVLDDETGSFRPIDPRIYILDHRWRDEEQWLVRARRAPDHRDFEPLPRLIERR